MEESSLQRKIEYLRETKEALKQALVSKGATIEDKDSFRSYTDKLDDIVGGKLICSANCINVSNKLEVTSNISVTTKIVE